MLNDQALAQQIEQSLILARDAASELLAAAGDGGMTAAQQILSDLDALLETLRRTGAELSKADAVFTLGICMESALHSLRRIGGMLGRRPRQALSKIEFELLPLIQEALLQFHYWALVHPDPERTERYYRDERAALAANPYIDRAMETGEYKYELSIVVYAYNKVEMTRQCIESLFRYLPEGLNYELILYNHGSTDGTQAYFEALNPHKQIDIKVNGVGLHMSHRIIEGEFFLRVSNDVYFTPGAVENMLRCLREDPSIGVVVPSTPNVSNLQTIPAHYGSLVELEAFARENNIYDPFRHEQRARLCDPLSMHRSATLVGAYPFGFLGHYFEGDLLRMFPDDLMAMLYRRNGIRSVLVKDAFCHHHGSATLGAETQGDQYAKGRVAFQAAFGIDPWGTGFCYNPDLASLLAPLDKPHIDILGVNAGLGSNPLKIKELYRELKRNPDVHLTNAADREWMLRELPGVSDAVGQFSTLEDLFDPQDRFDHIVCEDPLLGGESPLELARACFAHLHDGGSLLFRVNKHHLADFKAAFPGAQVAGTWLRADK